MKKLRFTSFMLIAVLLSTLFPLTASAQTTARVTQAQAVSWLRYLANNAIVISHKENGGYAGECASLALEYYRFLLGYRAFANDGGTGHGRDFDDANHSSNLGWESGKITADTALYAGDIIVRNSGADGHVAVYLEGGAADATVVHQNYPNDNKHRKTLYTYGYNAVGHNYVRPVFAQGDDNIADISDLFTSKISPSYRGKQVAFYSVEAEKYVSVWMHAADCKAWAPVMACADEVGQASDAWEKFTLSDSDNDGTINIRAVNSELNKNRYMTVTGGVEEYEWYDPNQPVYSGEPEASLWEAFKFYTDGSELYIQSMKSYKWLQADIDKTDNPIEADGAAPSTWERFRIEIVR